MYVQISAPISTLKVLWMATCAQTWPGGNVLAPASFWNSITFVLQPVHPHWGADSAYNPGRKQGVTQAQCICNTLSKCGAEAVVTLLHNSFKVTALNSADELPSQHHLVSWAGNVEGRAKILSLEGGRWAETPGGEETATNWRWTAQGQHIQRARISRGKRSSSRWWLTRNRLKQAGTETRCGIKGQFKSETNCS